MATVIGFDNTAKAVVTCKTVISGFFGSHPPADKSAAGCGAVIEYNRNDVKTYSGTDYSGGSDGREWVVCPNCGKEVTLRSW